MQRLRAVAAAGAVAATLAAAGCSPLGVQHGSGQLGLDRSGQVIFEDEAPSDLGKTKVLRVKVTQELPDLLVLDIEYNYVPTPEEDSCYLYVWPGPDREYWYTRTLHFQPGRNIGSVAIGLDEKSVSEESSNLSMTVTISRDKKALRPVFERIVPLPKVWGHRRPAPAGKPLE